MPAALPALRAASETRRDGVAEHGVLVLARHAEAEAQIHGTDEEHVHTVHGRDFVEVGESGGGFDLHHGQEPLVGQSEVVVELGAISARPRHRAAAQALRRIAHCGGGLSGSSAVATQGKITPAAPRSRTAFHAGRLVPGHPDEGAVGLPERAWSWYTRLS